MNKRTWIRTMGALIAMAAAGVTAQTYPDRAITLVVPYTPGTGIDIIARTVGPKLSERLGQPVVVDNKPGASGNIGADAVAKAAPNGYTLMVNVNTFAITPALFRNLPYDPVKDFAPITKAARGNLVLVVNPAALPARSLDELAAAARSQPGKLNYGSPGSGTPQHLAMELLKQRLGLDIVHVPYKGAAGALTDLLGGQVQMMVLPLHTALPHVRAGKLVAIGVTGESRSVLAGDIPSLAELGLKGLDLDLYFWFAAPAGTPPDVIARLNKEIGEILQQPDIRDGLLKQGLIPETSAPQAIAGQIAADVERWKKFVAERKITAD